MRSRAYGVLKKILFTGEFHSNQPFQKKKDKIGKYKKDRLFLAEVAVIEFFVENTKKESNCKALRC